MNAKVLIAGVAVAVMATGAVSAKTMKHHKMSSGMSGGSYAAPSQPIPYSQMDSYMAASPKARSAMMSGGGGMSSDSGMSSGASPSSSMGGAAPDAGGSMSSPPSAPSGSMAPGAATPPVNDGTPPMTGSTPPTTPPTTTPPQ